MGDHRQNRWQAAARSLACAAAAAALTACGGYSGSNSSYNPTPPPVMTPPPAPSPYSMTSLVSDGALGAATTDQNLKNPWGLGMAPGLPAWVANNATQTATIYDGTGQIVPLVVSLPGGINGAADVTGMVFNPFTTTNPAEFAVSNGTTSGPARFIMDGEGGTILAWAPTVDNNAVIAYDDGTGGAVYKGLAIASANGSQFLYATDFHNNKVDVFDSTFHKVTFSGGFTDPTLPANYAPFGIQALQIGSQTVIYVTYAQRQSTGDDNANGAGLGLVNVFDTSGTLLKHLVPVGGALNAPWGVALAPASFGNTLSNMVLIGNFGDGVINAYNPDTGAFVDSIKDSAGQPIANPGLWGIAFGNGARNQPASTLYFTAGIAAEADGLYGRIDLGATPPDAVAPTVTISAPAADATVSGTVTVSAEASDNVGVTSVEFFAGNTSLGTVTTTPFSFNWNTATVANGAVALRAVASDAAGNTTSSANVGVIVNNTAPPPAATLSELQTSIFTPRCSGCHTGGGTQLPGSMNLSSTSATFAALVNVVSEENPALRRVAPNEPANSYLIHKLTGTDIGNTARMPLGGPFLDQATIDQVSSWISAGAQNN